MAFALNFCVEVCMSQITLDSTRLVNKCIAGRLTRTNLEISKEYLSLVTTNLTYAMKRNDYDAALDYLDELIALAEHLYAYMFFNKATQLRESLSDGDRNFVISEFDSLLALESELEIAIDVFTEEELF